MSKLSELKLKEEEFENLNLNLKNVFEKSERLLSLKIDQINEIKERHKRKIDNLFALAWIDDEEINEDSFCFRKQTAFDNGNLIHGDWNFKKVRDYLFDGSFKLTVSDSFVKEFNTEDFRIFILIKCFFKNYKSKVLKSEVVNKLLSFHGAKSTCYESIKKFIRLGILREKEGYLTLIKRNLKSYDNKYFKFDFLSGFVLFCFGYKTALSFVLNRRLVNSIKTRNAKKIEIKRSYHKFRIKEFVVNNKLFKLLGCGLNNSRILESFKIFTYGFLGKSYDKVFKILKVWNSNENRLNSYRVFLS
ncbi:hypothetical protein RRG40_02580 [Mycoplasmopsis felis]|uniref:hypothetical protein n=1 Tax=Mycoplasmopsis felis TaxID=33923 RepID=UPI002AFE7FFA|nr:hypothetical protein [Mycoplasmopsis felis]WQQ05390.1 hypothetical protein RRG59_03510 [Mycoplasmopsis felis]